MGVAIPLGFVEDRASGALVVDGSLRFDKTKTQYLSRTISTPTSANTWTFSCWIKRNNISYSEYQYIFSYNSGASRGLAITATIDGNPDCFYIYDGTSINVGTARKVRDASGWYHLVLRCSSGTGTLYLNGESSPYITASSTMPSMSNGQTMGIGILVNTTILPLDAQLSNAYFIDGQALDPSYFGYTDPLTNVWRPKKLSSSVAFGTNGFYLPFDGSAPIGQDQSGRGNNWTPVNFGGSNTLEKATGALPILNTDGGGKVARVGVRTDSSASSLVLALPLVGIKSDFSNAVNSGTSNKAITANGNAVASSAQSNFYGGSFYFDGNGDYLSIPQTSDLDQNTDFTIEYWIYINSQGGSQYITPFGGNTNYYTIQFYPGQVPYIVRYAASTVASGGKISLQKWCHIALTKSGNTLRCFADGVLQCSGDEVASPTLGGEFNIGRNGSTYTDYFDGYMSDFRFYKGLAKYTQNFIPASTDPDILPDTPSGVSYSSNLTQITDGAVAFDGSGDYLSLANSADFAFGTGDFTIECFINTKSANGGIACLTGGSTGYWGLNINSSTFYWQSSVGVTNLWSYSASSILDGNWHHISVSRSGSLSRFFIDGILVATNTDNTNYSGTAGSLYIVRDVNPNELNGFISNLHVVKGTALYTSNFTPPTGPISSVANTKLLCCKSNSSATAADVTPGTITANGNAAASNFNPFTANINTQRGKQSGYCTLNPLNQLVSNSSGIENGNLTYKSPTSSSAYSYAAGTISFSSDTNIGYYYEVTQEAYGAYSGAGFIDASYYMGGIDANNPPGNTQNSLKNATVLDNTGRLCSFNSNPSYSSSWSDNGTVLSVAIKNNKVWYAINGIWIGGGPSVNGTPATTISTTLNLTPFALGLTYSSVGKQAFNFGQKPFKFPPPAGFQPLTLANTPRPTIVRPDQYVGISTWTGTGAARSITTGFKPDLVWVKKRGSTSDRNIITDSVRGANLTLNSDDTRSEASATEAGQITAFNGNGFSLGTNSNVTGNGDTFVAWSWKAGGNSNTYNINDVGYATASAAGLTAGTITPTGASVNTKSGFSIIKVPGTASAASFSHGLGQAPAFVILKETNGTGDWQVGHKSLSSGAWTSRLGLNLTTAEETTSSAWNNTPPTSSLITVGATSNVNNDFIVYAWAEVPGFSKFGLYTGNGSADGPMVITGFRPRWILVRSTSAARDWLLYDTARGVYNEQVEGPLQPNTSGTPYTNSGYTPFDILSNGFKPRAATTNFNANGETHIYAAFAETPTQNLYGAQANAR